MSQSQPKMPRMRPITEKDIQDETVVGYMSVNDKAGMSFTAVTDPNSRHAARLARLAMSVQVNRDQKAHDRSSRKTNSVMSWLPRIGAFQQPQPQPEYDSQMALQRPAVAAPPPPPPDPRPRQSYSSQPPTYQPSYPTQSHQAPGYYRESCTDSAGPVSSGPDIPSSYQTTDPDPWPANPTPSVGPADAPYYYYPSAADKEPAPPAAAIPRAGAGAVVAAYGDPFPAVAPPEVTRYRTEQKTAYKATGRTGRLYVSAPVGSNEAQFFDAIADAHSAEDEEGQRKREKRLVKKESRRKGRG